MLNKQKLTDLTKAARKALKADHAIDVPHSALRASLLKALGQHPHAFGKGSDTEQAPAPLSRVVAAPAPRRVDQKFVKVRVYEHLEEEHFLSLDPDGDYPIPQGFDLGQCIVVEVDNDCPDGDGLTPEEEVGRLRGLGLRVAPTMDVFYHCEFVALTLLVPQAQFTRLVHDIMKSQGLEDDVSYYLAEQHRLFWHQEDEHEQAVWFMNYIGQREDFWDVDEVQAEEIAASQPVPLEEPLPEGLKYVKALNFEAFVEAYRTQRQQGAFELEQVNAGDWAILYLDKTSDAPNISQDVWFEHIPARNSVRYVVRVMDHDSGEALCETESELSMARAAALLDRSIEQQLGLDALRREEQRRQERADF